MSIDSLQSSPWTNPWSASAVSQSGSNAPSGAASNTSFVDIAEIQASFSTSGATAPWSGQNASGSGNTGAASANPLQSLAADIQAMLIQTQNGAVQGGGATTAASPEQKVAGDLQTLFSDMQSATAPGAGTPAGQTADANPTAPAGETGHHHHHHHHSGGGEANGASDVAASSAAGTPAVGGQSVSTTFAADIAQALQAYGGGSIAAATPALIA